MLSAQKSQPGLFVQQDSVMRMPSRQQSDEELGRKLAEAELEVLQLNEFFKQVTQKYTEDIRKLEEKVQQFAKKSQTIMLRG